MYKRNYKLLFKKQFNTFYSNYRKYDKYEFIQPK